MSALTAAQLAEVTRLTGLDSDELNDLISCSKLEQATIIQGYKDMPWAKDKSVLKDVIAAFQVIMTIAGATSTIGGGILTLVSLLRLL